MVLMELEAKEEKIVYFFLYFLLTFEAFEGLFGGLFGRGRRDTGPKKVRPMVKEVKVTLEEVYSGTTKTITVERQRTCDGCEGKGGKDAKKCDKCKGHGMVEKIVQLGPGFLSSSRSVCPDCQGEGTVFDKKNQCKKCKGEKVVKDTKNMEVPIEQGAPEGHHVTFTGEGHEIVISSKKNLSLIIARRYGRRFNRQNSDREA
jgi:DnaJ-class molecular chaperone